MRVLHIEENLVSTRAERFIQLDSKLGHNVGFLGGFERPPTPKLDILDNLALYHVGLNRGFFLGRISNDHYEKLGAAIDDFDPDIIHAHNIHFLNFVQIYLKKNRVEIPIVYNDHEFWSERASLIYKDHLSSLNLIKSLQTYYKFRLFKRWEKSYVPISAVLTVSKEIADAHSKKYTPKFVSYIPNMPTNAELNKARFDDREEERTAVYVGPDFSKRENPFRDARGLLKMWRKKRPAKLILLGDPFAHTDESVKSLGRVPHMKIYEYSSNAHFGLLPYLPHYFHEYCSPNKIYIYIHSGALPILPKKLRFEVDVPRFSTAEEFFAILSNSPLPDVDEVKMIAKDTLIADRYLENLKQAYEITQ
ncbi:MAG: glycosyltransferase [Candidatus Heimdallarchaeota archaeon]|nr:MAG: glycosyltransferase [Candidatus Heimdallarchaeota archaeon]